MMNGSGKRVKESPMKNTIRSMTLASIGAAALVALSPAAHAQATGGTISDFSNDVGVGGSFTTGFNESMLTNPFTETLTFSTTSAGLLSIFVGSTATTTENDTDFTNAFLSGTGLVGDVLIPQLLGDPTEIRSLAGLGIGAGNYTLTVQGTPGTQNGSFGGSVAFVAQSAVPEPSTWAMMLFGFGAMGVAVRRRKHGANLTQMA
ncbi:MAG: FxDxF family PEP-CTERM protein [Sphingomicrobium sp.]